MKRSLVIEGLDASGKSTLVTKLAKHYGLTVYIAGPPAIDDDHGRLLCNMQLCKALHGQVFDRITSISRPCYQLEISDEHREEMDHYLKKMLDHCIVIYCNPETFGEHVVKEYDTKDHIDHITDNHSIISNNYTHIMGNINHLSYDFNRDSLHSLIQLIDSVR